MGLLLKSLKQIDWQPAEAPAEEELAQYDEAAPAIENPPDENAEPELRQEIQAADVAQTAEPESTAPEAIELPEPKEPEIQTAESTLDRLNELHDLIDSALEELSSAGPIVIEPPKTDASLSESEIASEQLEKSDRAVEFSPFDASTDTVVPPPVISKPVVVPVPVILNPHPKSQPAPAKTPAVKIRDEYRELRDHLLAKFRLDEPSTLLAIDAGRVTNDASWLAPFAACLWETLREDTQFASYGRRQKFCWSRRSDRSAASPGTWDSIARRGWWMCCMEPPIGPPPSSPPIIRKSIC